MEESTNTFTGGLNQDLNPIATPNSVLTDAKNATFITFNGNEMSLQNDMGNTKITYTDPLTNVKQSVTLPQGYVPLGVKEYGGILYIVSKNPSTEQVEIGSFPAPEFVSQDEKLLSIDETKITDNGVLLRSELLSESGFFDITTEILHPCDIIKDYSFFPLNFETISTQDERRLFKYKLINNSTRKDITNLSKPFNLSNKVWYKTLWLTKNNVQKYDVVVIFPNVGKYTYYTNGEESGIKPDEFISYKYEVNGELKLSMYYEGVEGIKYTFSPSGGRAQALLDFEYGGDGIYYFPNLQPGALSFKFYTETIDYFNLHRIVDSVVKYSPELVKEAFKFDDDVINNITEIFANTFFTTNEDDTITPKQFTSPNEVTGNTILSYASNKYPLQICSDKGAVYTSDDDFNLSILDESKRFMTLSYTGDEFIHQVETNDQQYSLKFNKIKVDQLSWVKVNKVIFSYEIFNNENPSFIIKRDTQTYDDVKIIDGEWDISGLSIAIPSEEREITLGAFLGKEDSTKYLGTVLDEDVVLSSFIKLKVSNILGAPNYTVKFSFTPYNTDYNIDISQFKIDRTIDLTKSPDSWEGNLVFKDNENLINVSLDNCLIRKSFEYYSLWDLKDDLPISELSNIYKHWNKIPLAEKGEVGDYKYQNIKNTHYSIKSGSKIYSDYFISDPPNTNITLLNKVDLDLNKYFSWSGIVSPNLQDSLTYHKGDIAFVNFGNHDYYEAYNILEVGELKSTTSRIIDKRKMGRVDAPSNLKIVSDNGLYDASNIKRGVKSEREKDTNYTLLCLAQSENNYNVSNPDKLGYTITATNIKYKGSKSYLSKYSQLYYIRKNASDAPCDSFGQQLIDPEFIPENAYGFNNIFNSNDLANLYTSIVPIKSDVLSRALIELGKQYISTFKPDVIFTFSFYLSKNFKGSFICNADVLKIRTDKEIIDSDSILLNSNQYDKYESIDIESGSKKYTRVVLICNGNTLSSDFYFEFKTMTSGGIIYNPIIYNSKLINQSSSSADCVDLRGQGMRLFNPEGYEEYVNKRLGSYKLHADYVPEPFYEIID